MNVKDLALSSLFSVFIIIGSMIKIPVPFVPFTLQVLAICLSALLLTRKQAVMAVLIYIIMGLIGLPVFAGGMSGPNIVMSPTFGFILGFIPMVYIINTLYHKLPKNHRFLAFVAGETILYTLALPILYFNLKTYHGIALPISKLFISYCFMFIPTDVLSMTLSAFIASRMPEHIKNKKDA